MKRKKLPTGYVQVEKSGRNLKDKIKLGKLSDESQAATITIIVRRRTDTPPIKSLEEFQSQKLSDRITLTHEEFKNAHGASQTDVDIVVKFAKNNGLEVIETDLARRSIVVRGNIEQINKAFAIQLHELVNSKHHRSFSGYIHLPTRVAKVVEHIIGLDNQQVNAKHYAASANPPGTKSLTPQQVAKLYNYPQGDGAGQTIGIYEMITGDGPPGYNANDLALTINAFGGGLKIPVPIDVPVDGQTNTHISDGETVLDITVAGAIAQGAAIAVYFTGSSVQNMVHALQKMIHPNPSVGDPVPTILSISYGWGPDDDTSIMNSSDYIQMSALFQDAAQLGITVLVSSGDTGAQIDTNVKQAEASYPATDPWVLACGGTTIGNIKASSFSEYVWNDGEQGGATGGGVSVQFPVPAYQNSYAIPKRNVTGGKVGRGIPDVAGNASPYSGYPLFLQGKSSGPIGGTSAVAPLYAGLVAILNSLLGENKVGFLNPTLYILGSKVCKDIASPPGPLNNNFDSVKGYPCGKGWDACTGLGVVDGSKLLTSLKAGLEVHTEA
jgi:kumamolisin